MRLAHYCITIVTLNRDNEMRLDSLRNPIRLGSAAVTLTNLDLSDATLPLLSLSLSLEKMIYNM